jgi:hypothetical protein
MTQALATSGGVLAANRQQQQPPSRFRNEEPEDTILPRVHIFQGLPKEEEIYGRRADGTRWEAGDLINTLNGEKIDSNKFVPILGWPEWICFREPRGSGIEYKFDDKSRVPPQDLEWTGEGSNQLPPRATKSMNFAVIFEGIDEPLVLSFKTTSINAGKSLNQLEKFRGNKGPGFYSLDLQSKQNAKGKWLSPKIRPIGNPSGEMKAQAETMFEMLSGVKVTVAEEPGDGLDDAGGEGSGDAGAPGEFNPDKL